MDGGCGKGACLVLPHTWPYRFIPGTSLAPTLEGNNSIEMVEEYILTSAKSKIGNIGGKLLDYNHYYTEKGFCFM